MASRREEVLGQGVGREPPSGRASGVDAPSGGLAIEHLKRMRPADAKTARYGIFDRRLYVVVHYPAYLRQAS